MLFRNRRLVRATACFFLLEIVGNLALPAATLAMSGPSQPEFTSYEAPGSTDMVNLSTGNFSFSVPAIDVPGPERSFSLPLSYNAGIQLEQEASWVGLGWSLNAGAIARSVNGYPDDANNEPIRMSFNKAVDKGWNASLPGLVELGWNSQTGHYGSVDLLGLAKVGWDKNGLSEGDLVGIGYSSAHGFGVDPVRMASAAYTIATFGAATPFTIAANIGIQAGTSAALTAGLRGLGVGVLGGVAGFNNQPTRDIKNHLWGEEYWNFFNTHTTENAFGSLHFGKMSQNVPTGANTQFAASPLIHFGSSTAAGTHVQPFHNNRHADQVGTETSETAADVYQDGELREDNPTRDANSQVYYPRRSENSYYITSRRPISTAHDNFNVMGEHVSGSIRPHRLEVGSVAYPKMGVDVAYDNQLYHYKYMVVPFLDDYKVGFRYENASSNTYTYHLSAAPAGREAEGFDNLTAGKNNAVEMVLTDPKLLNAKTETARKGLQNSVSAPADRQLVQGKHVVWYTNAEIKTLYANSALRVNSSFLEFESPAPNSTSNNPFRESLPPSGIGAFAVTAEDGTTYHYSLPVYQFKTFTEANEVRTASTIGDGLGRSTRTTGEAGATNPNNPTGASATTWLLTAVTSADYIDRNNSGTADAGDWGGWVQFKYGKFSSQYKWRQPYLGGSYSDDSPDITSLGYTEGYKETYYLNSIATRTHTALFIKSIREDARGHFRPGVAASASNLGIDEQRPASSLRLDEVILLDNATLAKLQTADGIRAANDPNPVPALTTGTYPGHPLIGTVIAADHLENVLDVTDFTDGGPLGPPDTRIRDFVYANCIKRTRFNYDYKLCPGVPSSFYFDGTATSLPSMSEANSSTGRGGKLTLESLSFFGPAPVQTPSKIVPDFVFGYGTANDANPAYGKELWDAFGMYNPAGTRNVSGHRPNPSSSYQAPWSLTKITSPLGGVTDIQYERDQYAHVSEFGTRRIHLSNSNCGATFNTSLPGGGDTGIDLRTVLQSNQTVYVTGEARYSPCNVTGTDFPARRVYNNTPMVVASVANASSNNAITLSAGLTPDVIGGPCGYGSAIPYGADLDLVIPSTVTGGDVRVAQITTSADGSAYRVRYKYVEDLSPSGATNGANSTGVLAKEPAFLNRFERPANGMFDYPTTPVIYSKVTVLRGKLGDDLDYDTREMYAFYTPSTDMVSETNSMWRKVYTPNTPEPTDFIAVNNRSEIRTGLIGQAKEISTYNRGGQQELLTKLTYASVVRNPDNIAKQGQFTEGVLNNEWMVLSGHTVNRSTKTYFPAVLSSTQSYRNGVSIRNENTLYDFYTGQPVESTFRNTRNEVYHTRSIPAYYKYAGMGPKGDDASNSHMLSQLAAVYTVKEKSGGSPYNPLDFLNPGAVEVLAAGVQTWQGTWSNYRAPGTGQNPTGYVDAANSPRPIWREASAYQWQSPFLNPNGSFANFVDYGWLGSLDSRWIKTDEVVRYDHYSHSLEAKDLNGLYSAQKTGYNQSQQIASASNARFTELAYSGAEDVETGNAAYFGGEVVVGGVVDPTQAHTGRFSNRLDGPGDGFVYRARAGSTFDNTEVVVGKPYRLSVWVRPGNGGRVQDAQLFTASGGATLAQPWTAPLEVKKAGDWYRLTTTVTLPSSSSEVSFGCRNTGSGTLYFDDFRTCPFNATMSSNVYNPRTNNLTEALNNENLFTRFDYNSAGRLARVYKEALDRPGDAAHGARLVQEYAYNYARNVSYAASVSVTGAPAGSTISPAGPVPVIVGDAAEFTLKPSDCAYVLASSFVVDGDGVVRTGSYTLPDNTQITVSGFKVLIRNVRGAHAVALAYQPGNFDPAGTLYGGQCEINGNGCYTGQYLYYEADGCGGQTGPLSRPARAGECPLQEGCPSFVVKPTAAASAKQAPSVRNDTAKPLQMGHHSDLTDRLRRKLKQAQ